MTSEIVDLIKERWKIIPRNSTEYIRLNKNIRNKTSKRRMA